MVRGAPTPKFYMVVSELGLCAPDIIILERVRTTMAAAKIQNTWRLMKERDLAEENKKINYECTLPKYYVLFDTKDKKVKKKVMFGETMNEVMDDEGFFDLEELTHEDCLTRPSYNFAILTKMWTKTFYRDTFFERPTTLKMMENISEEEMTIFIDQLISALNDGVVVLWGPTGGTVKFYQINRLVFEDLKDAWSQHLDKFQEVVSQLGRRQQSVSAIKKFTFNAEAIEFKPVSLENSIGELNKKAQQLIDMNQIPICVATPL